MQVERAARNHDAAVAHAGHDVLALHVVGEGDGGLAGVWLGFGADGQLGVQLVISAILLALFTLRATPGMLIKIIKYFEMACAGSAAWTGMISIGVACLGASAHAAISAL
jgi:hypothetical protein